jgi:hypothetical protein
MIDNRTSAGPRAWHPTYRIEHVSPSGKKEARNCGLYIRDAEGEATPRARASKETGTSKHVQTCWMRLCSGPGY